MLSAPIRPTLAIVLLIGTQAVDADLSESLRQAQQSIDQDKLSAAINTLERVLPDAQGSPDVLDLLRRAYRGEIRNLVLQGEHKAAQGYLDRLRLIEQQPTQRPVQKDVPSVKVLSVSPAQPAKAEPTGDERPALNDQESTNAAGEDEPSLVLRRANALFLGRQYAEAGRLYEQVQRSGAAALEDARDRWTYCRLVSVVEQINRPPRSQKEWSTIKAEVDSIVQTIPGNEYALSLRRMVERQGKPFELARVTGEPVIRANSPDQVEEHERSRLAGLASRIGLGQGGDATKRSLWQRFRSGGWQVLETSNFRIYHSDERLAGPAADIAESTRIELYRLWFGRVPESNWNPKCDIYIHPSTDSYVRVTGQGPGSPGHSATGIDRGRILSRRVDLRRDGQDLIQAVLPHEITHVVMADRFTSRPLPRWADEGVAVLTEPPEKKTAHLKNLSDFVRNGRLYSAQQLMTMSDYPAGQWWGLFYAQSVSLVDFLAERAGPDKFIDFMSRSLQNGYEPELKRVYGFASFAELDREWSQRRTTPVTAADARVVR